MRSKNDDQDRHLELLHQENSLTEVCGPNLARLGEESAGPLTKQDKMVSAVLLSAILLSTLVAEISENRFHEVEQLTKRAPLPPKASPAGNRKMQFAISQEVPKSQFGSMSKLDSAHR